MYSHMYALVFILVYLHFVVNEWGMNATFEQKQNWVSAYTKFVAGVRKQKASPFREIESPMHEN